MTKLVIVESPAKAKKIQSILGNKYIVKSSYGHLRDLSKKNLGVDVDNNFKPKYIVMKDKYKQVNILCDAKKKCDEVILASDEDREGEAIAWHICYILKIKPEKTKRIVFHEITKNAILEAIKNPRTVDINMVNAQQTRRILDRLVGFKISPLLWKAVKPSLSAGRVQSVVNRLIIDKESDIEKFERESYYQTSGEFNDNITGELDKKYKTRSEAFSFLDGCKVAKFYVRNIETKREKRKPPPPFITSTMQQVAGTKLKMSAKMVMRTAQTLYEGGYITYHRTDSVVLSKQAISQIKGYIEKKYGDKYIKIRKYKSKSKGAQEAHEAIRPTNINANTEELSTFEKKLYMLIWKRAIASQMAEMLVDVTKIEIEVTTSKSKFIAKTEKIIFKGYMILYEKKETKDVEKKKKKIDISKILIGNELKYKKIESTQKYTNPKARYSEPTVIKKLETLGIGRPSTYASMVSLVQDRGYVEKKSKVGKEVEYEIITLFDNVITNKKEKTKLNAEKNKLYPTEIGKLVNKYLMKNFSNIVDYKFTSNLESKLDNVSQGTLEWKKLIGKVYQEFNPKVEELNKLKYDKKKRLVGKENNTGLPIYAYIARYGPVLQIGDKDVRYVKIPSGKTCEKITEEEANTLAAYPKILGKYEDKDIILNDGRYGLYIKWNDKNFNIKDKDKISLSNAIEIIKSNNKKVLREVSKTIKIMNGPYGPYVMYNKKFASIPKDKDINELTIEECKELISNKKKYVPNKYKKKKN
jgi:DNA topoisomerase I